MRKSRETVGFYGTFLKNDCYIDKRNPSWDISSHKWLKVISAEEDVTAEEIVPVEMTENSPALYASNVTIISEGGSYDTLSVLRQVNVDANNTVYSSEDGVLYSADKQRLVYYPTCKAEELYVIPSSVWYVNGWAIFGNQSLQSLVIPVSVISMNTATNPRECPNITDALYLLPRLSSGYELG